MEFDTIFDWITLLFLSTSPQIALPLFQSFSLRFYSFQLKIFVCSRMKAHCWRSFHALMWLMDLKTNCMKQIIQNEFYTHSDTIRFNKINIASIIEKWGKQHEVSKSIQSPTRNKRLFVRISDSVQVSIEYSRFSILVIHSFDLNFRMK